MKPMKHEGEGKIQIQVDPKGGDESMEMLGGRYENIG